jgi:hypothetical protein
MAKRNTPRGGRSRKQRPRGQGTQAGPAAPAPVKSAPQARPRSRERASARPRDERPQAPWHPWPLSELLILVGAIGTVVGVSRLKHGGVANAGPVLLAGIAAVAIGTLEVTLREHRGGYRSHTLLLSLLPVIIFHTATVLLITAFTRLSAPVNLGLLALDVALFAFLFRLWRARFVDARRLRAFGGR